MTATLMPWPVSVAIAAKLHLNHRAFERRVERARRLLRRGDLEEAAAAIEAAAGKAWADHPGRYGCGRLEAMLVEIGRQLGPPPAGGREHPGQGPMRILHVLSAVSRVGGHTRLVANWIANDVERTHAMVLTRPHEGPLPDCLPITPLLLTDTGLLGRAASLRRIAADYDLAILHTHPDDGVPALAFADPDTAPPVVLLNHADHAFWLGATTSTAIANIRASGAELAARRRGIAPPRNLLLPLPLADPAQSLDKREARRRLGLPHDAVVLLSLASGFKYAPHLRGPGFIPTAEAALAAHPEVLFLVVGPSPEGDWGEALARTSGRLRVLGEIADPTDLYRAADVYVGSFPIASLTAVLEAGLHGLPVLNYCPFQEAAPTLGMDDPALGGLPVATADWQAYDEALSRLISDSGHRHAVAQAQTSRIREAHTGVSWRQALDAFYAALWALPRHGDRADLPPRRRADVEDRCLVYGLMMARREISRGFPLVAALDRVASLFPQPQPGAARRLPVPTTTPATE